MERKLLKEEINDITMPGKMRERILKNCRNAKLEEKENVFMDKNITVSAEKKDAKNNVGRKWTRFATVAAAVTLCLGLGGITAMAASGKMEGFFADVTRWDGAVIGETYEQATEEIEVSATVSGDSIIVDAVLLKAGEAPYAFLENISVQTYSIVNEEGETVAEGTSNEKAGITDGKISLKLPLDELEGGNYTLIITEFIGSAKAEQDLPIKGYWVCEFEL